MDTKPGARGLGFQPSPRVQGFGGLTQTKGKVIVPILTLFRSIFAKKMLIFTMK